MNKYIVMERNTSFGGYQYKKIAIVLIDDDILKGKEPKMLSNRSIGVVEIYHEYDSCPIGKTMKSKYMQYKTDAEETVKKLNAEIASCFCSSEHV